MSLSGCRNDHVAIDPKDPNSPKFEYRKDEFARLEMIADDIQELERKKAYATIYDDYASDAFKQGVGRRRFLIMANCVESFLGGIEEYDRNELGFRRQFNQKPSPVDPYPYMDVLNRKVQRILGNVEEQMVFVPNGLNFRLNGLYWIAKDKQFLSCIAQSPQLDASSAPVEVPKQTTEGNGAPDVSAKSQGASGTQGNGESTAPQAAGATTNAGANGSGSGTTDEESKEKPAQEQAARSERGTGSGSPLPVQGMKTSEVKKHAIEARPAGAGAVVDIRPMAKKNAEDKKAAEGAAKKRIEPESVEMVPLPTTGGSDD